MFLLYSYAKKKRAEKRRNEASESKDAGPLKNDSLQPQAAGIEPVGNAPETMVNEKSPTLDTQDGPLPNDESAEEKRRRRIYRWKLLIALFPCQFLASVDITIVSTSLTTISSHFRMSNVFKCLCMMRR